MARTTAPTHAEHEPGRAATVERRAPVRRTLPEKLDHLFATIRPPGQYREYTHKEIAERAAAAGQSVSAPYVNALRRDASLSPSLEKLEAIAAAFGISVAYFLNDDVAAQLEENLGLIAALNRPEVRKLVLDAADLSPESLAAIGQFVRRAREWEGLGAWADDQDTA